MKKIINTAWLIITLILSVYLITLAVNYYKNTHFTCSGEYAGSTDGVIIKTKIFMTFNGSKGDRILDGKMIDKDGTVHKLRYYSLFTFTYNNKRFYSTNLSVSPMAGDTVSNEKLKQIMPAYILEAGNSFSLNFSKNTSSGYLFRYNQVPIFYCYP